jgi:DNA transposition AAA+ family ATPase
MTAKEAQAVAQKLGAIEPNDQKLQKEIERLRCRNTLELKQVKTLHDWLDGKRQSRQSGRVVESRVQERQLPAMLTGYGTSQGK